MSGRVSGYVNLYYNTGLHISSCITIQCTKVHVVNLYCTYIYCKCVWWPVNNIADLSPCTFKFLFCEQLYQRYKYVSTRLQLIKKIIGLPRRKFKYLGQWQHIYKLSQQLRTNVQQHMEDLVLSGFPIVDIGVFERHFAVLQFKLVT